MAANSSQIPAYFVQQFSSNLQLKLQQEGSVLRSSVMTGTHVGSQASPVDQVGAIVANKVTGRFGAMQHVDAPADRRWVFPVDYDLPQLIDSFDKLRLLVDPSGPYTTNAVNALGRAMDQEILNGLLGTNYTGNSGSLATTIPTTQIVSVQQGAASPQGLTVAKLRAAKRILMANYGIDFNKKPEIYCAITAQQHDNLLAETQIINADYNNKPALNGDGMVESFMGIKFIHTELLSQGTDDQGGTSTAVPLWIKDGVYMGLWSDISTSVSQRHDLQSEPWQAYVKGTFGATRLEEKKIVQIWSK